MIVWFYRFHYIKKKYISIVRKEYQDVSNLKNNRFDHQIHILYTAFKDDLWSQKKYSFLACELSFSSNQSVFHFDYSLLSLRWFI